MHLWCQFAGEKKEEKRREEKLIAISADPVYSCIPCFFFFFASRFSDQVDGWMKNG